MFGKTTIFKKSNDKKVREIIEAITMMTMEDDEYVSSTSVKLTKKEFTYLMAKKS